MDPGMASTDGNRDADALRDAPRMFRSMKEEAGHPLMGANRAELGARLPGGRGEPDIEPDGDGLVHPGRGGMSVAPSLRHLPPHLVPRRLRGRVREATGPNHFRVWRMGEGPFARGAVGPRLRLRPSGPHHGMVEPSGPMAVGDYQEALGSTRDAWVIDES